MKPNSVETAIAYLCMHPKSNQFLERFLLIDQSNADIKSVILQYNTLGHWVDGPNDSSTKRLMFQVLFFFIISNRLRALKTFYFNFCKAEVKSFNGLF